MNEEDYYALIFEGYLDNKQFFSEHLIRSQKLFFTKHRISNFEFFKRSLDLVNSEIDKTLRNQVERIKYNQKIIKENYSEDSVAHAKSQLKEASEDNQFYYLKNQNPFTGSSSKSISLNELKNISTIINNLLLNKEFKSVTNLSTDTKDREYDFKIFVSLEAEKLLLDYLELYRESDCLTADFSFIFYAMSGSKLIHCSGAKFKRYLDAKEVVIDRIDSKQSGWKNNTKYTTFKLLLDKHIGS